MGVSAYEEPKRRPKPKPRRPLDARFETPSKQHGTSFQQITQAAQTPITPKETAGPNIQITSSTIVLLARRGDNKLTADLTDKNAYDLSAR